ncbi:MAG: 6-carboxytetrahydropterin synthase QueD [Burkholderiales bacterium]|nr:6-carboxytetrahydropterin synthase QueD [Burkholderiales bacterium]MCW5606314.1 6-carboxytetrahydropterin synthase QueD [Burkholderiales bacterium]
MRITRRLEFDAGHRIPNHTSQCRHLHGHRYAIEITLSGPLIATPGAADEGMVMDFSAVKAIAQQHVIEPWDHAFLAWRQDKAVIAFLDGIPEHKTVLFDAPPTAEHLAQTAFALLDRAYAERYGDSLRLERVRLYETPNCWADALRGETA